MMLFPVLVLPHSLNTIIYAVANYLIPQLMSAYDHTSVVHTQCTHFQGPLYRNTVCYLPFQQRFLVESIDEKIQ